jgi:hypothetical protein
MTSSLGLHTSAISVHAHSCESFTINPTRKQSRIRHGVGWDLNQAPLHMPEIAWPSLRKPISLLDGSYFSIYCWQFHPPLTSSVLPLYYNKLLTLYPQGYIVVPMKTLCAGAIVVFPCYRRLVVHGMGDADREIRSRALCPWGVESAYPNRRGIDAWSGEGAWGDEQWLRGVEEFPGVVRRAKSGTK